MSATGVRGLVAEVAAGQWGLLTTAQASAAGVTRMMLSRMVTAGELERVLHGVYATPSAAGGELAVRRALWLSLEPDRLAFERLADSPPVGVISHASAAAMHELGDIAEPQVEVILPARYRTRRAELRAHRGELGPGDVSIVDGLPVTTPERTIADLVRDGYDHDHVATATAEGLFRGRMTVDTLEAALDDVDPSRSGREVLRELLTIAGIDPDSLTAAVLTSPLGSAAVQEAAQRLVAQQLAPFVEQHRLLQQQIAELSPSQVDEAVGDQARKVMRPVIDQIAKIAASVPKVERPDSYWNSTAGLRETTQAWRRMVMAQRTTQHGTDRHAEDEESGCE